MSYSYDVGNRLTQVQDSVGGTITRSYDDFDRLASETTPQGMVSYTYDAAGNRISMTVQGQPTVTYSYDADGRLSQITQGSATVAFSYDADGRRTSLTLPNGIVASYSYDADSELTGIVYSNSTSTIGTFTYTYDAAGKELSRGGTLFASVLPSVMTSATYDAANRLVHQVTASGGDTLVFDANGNLTSDGAHSYSWDARNRLMSIDGGANTVYDALGRRQTGLVGGQLLSFVYDGDNPIQEQSNGSVLANILSGLNIDERFMRTEGQTSSFYLVDALGSVAALTDATGAIRTSYGYDPYGNTTVTGATNDNSYQYTGRQNGGVGLYNYRARYYSATLRRFISEDPIGFVGGINMYAYTSGNPVQFTDPSGESVFFPGHIGPGLPIRWFPGLFGPPGSKRPSNDEDCRCKDVKKKCIDECTSVLPTDPRSQGIPFFNCVNQCLANNGCGGPADAVSAPAPAPTPQPASQPSSAGLSPTIVSIIGIIIIIIILSPVGA